MLVQVTFDDGRKLTYKITAKEVDEGGIHILKVFAPLPLTLRQKRKLASFLNPYEGMIIYPKGFNTKDFPKPYPAYENYCKKLILDFLNTCKNKQPHIAVIVPNGRIKEKFYFDLSEYVGKIIIKESAVNEDLQNKLLEYSGTILEYNINFEQKGKGILKLDIPASKTDYFLAFG